MNEFEFNLSLGKLGSSSARKIFIEFGLSFLKTLTNKTNILKLGSFAALATTK